MLPSLPSRAVAARPAVRRLAAARLLSLTGTDASGVAIGFALYAQTRSTAWLSLSLLLAFAMLYPEVQVLLFFVIPVRVKYFGLFAAAMWLFSFLTAGWLYKVSYLLSMLGFALFFGPQALRSVRAWIRREQWKRKNRR